MRGDWKVLVLLMFWLNLKVSNPHNLVKSYNEALSEMRDARKVAQNRGIELKKYKRKRRRYVNYK